MSHTARVSLFSKTCTLFMALSLVAPLGCPGEPAPVVTCGTGTKLNAEGTQCIPASTGGGFNVVVEDFSLGDFALTQVDVPEQMQPGIADQRTFSIQNVGEEDQDVVLINLYLVPVEAQIGEVRTEIELLDSPQSCDEENSACTTSTSCNFKLGVCELNTTAIGGVLIEDLAAGEIRDITHELKIPASWTQPDGMYALVFAINEVALTANGDGTVRLEEQQPDTVAVPHLASAAAVHAPATVLVGVADKPNLRVLFARTSVGAFELGDYAAMPAPIVDFTARISAQGKDAVAPVSAQFELLLPGHDISVPGQDLGAEYFEERGLDFDAAPVETAFVYNENRSFPLYFGAPEVLGDELNPTVVFQTQYVKPSECIDFDLQTATCTREASVENDIGADVLGALTLSTQSQRLLWLTRSLAPQLNPDLDEHGEILGAIRMTLVAGEPEYEINGVPLLMDNSAEIPIVFMAPQDGDTTDGDEDEDVIAPQPLTAACCGPYEKKENATPAQFSQFGNEWLGGAYSIKSETSRKEVLQATVATRTEADHFVNAELLQSTYSILGLYGVADVGSQRDMEENVVEGRVTFMGSTLLDIRFSGAYERLCSNDEVTVVDLQGEPRQVTSEVCTIIEVSGSISRPPLDPEDPTAGLQNTQPKKRGWTLHKEWPDPSEPPRPPFMAGPVPLTWKVEAGLTVGMVAGAYMVREASVPEDETSPANNVFMGLQFGVGPYADISVTVFGGATLGVARAGLEGSVTILNLEFKPTLNFGIAQELNEDETCWLANGGKISFEGELGLTLMEGKVSAVAYAGVKGCAFWVCVDMEVKIFEFKLWNGGGANYALKLWELSKLFAQGDNLCEEAEPPVQTWKTPQVCGSSTTYCNEADGTGGYAKTFALPGDGAQLELYGETERNYDFLKIYDDNGVLIRTYHGKMPGQVADITGTSAITVRLFSDRTVTKSGVAVKVAPYPGAPD